MSYGINIIGENGNNQIQEGYLNYIAYQEGVIADGTLGSSITNLGEMIFIRPQSGTGNLWLQIPSSGYAASMFRCSSGNIEYVAAKLGNSISPSTDSNGIKIFGADGSIVFDSGFKYLIPIAVGYIPPTISSQPTATITLPAGLPSRKRYVDYSIFRPLGSMLNPNNQFASYSRGPHITFNSSTSISVRIDTIGAGPPHDVYVDVSQPFFIGDF